MDWRTFFLDLFSADKPEAPPQSQASRFDAQPKPGAVMICFVNRYLEALDGVKYKIVFEGKRIEGVTTSKNYCFKVQTETLDPIRVSVWSRRTKNFKALKNVIPVPGKSQLVRKILASAKVQTRTEKHPEAAPADAPPKKLPPPTTPGPSPEKDQGVVPTPTRNEKAEPQTQASRPVPGMITLAQLRKIFTNSKTASDAYLQSVADELNRDLALYKLDTPLRRAHFFAQVKGETGNSMKPKRESWVYSAQTLKSFSRYYRAHPAEAEADGYLKDARGKIIRPTNEDAVGRKHFANLNGNRAKTHPEDGSNFRGRGLLQLTGYEKYLKFKEQYSRFWSGPVPDSISDPEIIVKFPYLNRHDYRRHF